MKIFFSVLLSLVMSCVSAQTVIESFSVTQVESSVQVDWTVGPGNTCSDLQIRYSIDSITFNTIYEYPGICGNTGSSQSYAWIFTSPVCGFKSYFQVVSATEGTLAEASLNVVCFGETGVISVYNPLSGNIIVNANIPSGANWTYNVYDLNGQPVLTFPITEYSTSIVWNPLHSGIYVYEMLDEQGKSRSGHLLIRKQ